MNNKEIENAEYGVDSRYASDKERKADGKMLMAARLERMKKLNPNLIIQAELLSLKLRMEEYLTKNIHEERNIFLEFLSEYIDTVCNKRNQFAEDIGIASVKLSHILSKRREPQEKFFLKLMIHSELTYKNVGKFKGEIWFQVYFHEKICDTMANQDKWRPVVEKQVRVSNLVGV